MTNGEEQRIESINLHELFQVATRNLDYKYSNKRVQKDRTRSVRKFHWRRVIILILHIGYLQPFSLSNDSWPFSLLDRMYRDAFRKSQSLPRRAQKMFQGGKLSEVVRYCKMNTFVESRQGDVIPCLAGPAEVVQMLRTRCLF